MQPSYIFVEDVFVVCETGQGTMYGVIQTEELLRVLVKSFVRSLSSLFQRIDRIDHRGEGGEFHL